MKKISLFLNRLINLTTAIPLIIMAFLMFLGQSKAIFTNGTDSARLIFHNNYFIYLVCFILVLLLFYQLYLKTSTQKPKLWLFFLISLIIKLIVVFSFPVKYYYDMGFYMNNFAKNMVNNFSLDFGMNMLSYYYFNIPLVFIYTLYIKLAGFENAFFVGYLVNVISMILIEYAIYKISLLLFDQKTANFALKIALIFVPFYSFLPIVYNDIISCLLFMWAIYFFLKYLKLNHKKDLIFYLIILSIGIIFRNIGSIIALASIMYLIINRFKKSILIIFTLILIILSLNNTKLYDKVYESLGIYNSAGAKHVNIINYLAIGISNGVDNQSPGYYYPFDVTIFNYVDESYVLKQQEYNKVLINFIKDRIKELKIEGLAKHYFTKFLLTWGDGSFEGNLFLNFIPNKDESAIKYFYRNQIHKFTQNPIVYETINTYSQVFWHLLIIVITINIIKNSKQMMIELNFLKLIILGIMSFYILLETSSHYVFLSLPLFIILFAESFKNIYLKK